MLKAWVWAERVEINKKLNKILTWESFEVCVNFLVSLVSTSGALNYVMSFSTNPDVLTRQPFQKGFIKL
jgi:hypothetical protein